VSGSDDRPRCPKRAKIRPVRALAIAPAVLVTACGISVAGEGPAADAGGSAPMDAATGGHDRSSPPPPPLGDASDEASANDASANDDGSNDAALDVTSIGDAATDGAPTGTYSLSFDGVATYVDCGRVQIPGDFTLEAWVNPAGYSGETYVMAEDRDYQPQGQFRFGFIDTGQLFFVMSDAQGNSWGLWPNTSGPYALVSPSPVPTNAWTQIAVTKSGAAFALLVDGTTVVPFTATQSFSYGDGGNHNPFRIGSRVGQDGVSGNGFFRGLIDEVRLWHVARTPAQITGDLRREIAKTDGDWSQLTDYWPFDEGQGTTTADRAGPYPGTLASGPTWVTQTAF
jgi:hypothetical protein